MDFTSRTFTSITINGRTYRSLDEMPPEDRRQYEALMSRFMTDKNNNGIPDFVEGAGNDSAVSYVHQEIDIASPLKARMLDSSPPNSSVLPYRAEPRGQRGITIHMTFAALVALAAIVAIVGAAAWWVVRL